MSKTGFFSRNGAIGIGGSSNSDLLGRFGSESLGADSIRLLVGNSSSVATQSNRLLEIANNHVMRVECNSNWFGNGFSITHQINTVNGSNVVVSCNGDLTLSNGDLVFTNEVRHNIKFPDGQPQALVFQDSAGDIIMTLNTVDNAPCPLTVYGNICAASSTIEAIEFLTTSDATLKTDIELIKNPLDILRNIDGVSYRWKTKSKSVNPIHGVIAQDVEQVLPGAVHTNPRGHKRVDYNQLIGVLIEGFKYLDSKLNSGISSALGLGQDDMPMTPDSYSTTV